jgi:hypothetical protein
MAVCGLLGLGSTAWSQGRGSEAPSFPLLQKRELTLSEALKLTLAHEPNLALRREDVKAKEGLSLQAAGAFDLTLIGSVSYEFTQRPLSAAEKLDQKKKRD